MTTGAREDLRFVSPRSGGAVSARAALGYETKLLRLPRFLVAGSAADWADILDGLALTGHFLTRDVLIGRSAEVLAARERLVERLKRAA